MRRGDTEAAKAHLLAAGETSGSPQLDSFGPDMELAKALLHAGEIESVIAYLRACSKFWQCGAAELAGWIAAIERGEKSGFFNG